ncbi:MAG TPA: PIN domain-containing protein, partial [Bryobacteraceae bacterium]|nr:PIN domain-containing protein [Bryobacteraceae bacterium]
DSSALVPLIVDEPASLPIRALFRAGGSTVVWWASPVECASALERRRRAGQLKYEERNHSERLLSQLAAVWTEVQPGRAVRECALRLLRSHELRAADALQLAAALVWAEDEPSGRAFVCLDERLREAARQSGFTVLPEEKGEA